MNQNETYDFFSYNLSDEVYEQIFAEGGLDEKVITSVS